MNRLTHSNRVMPMPSTRLRVERFVAEKESLVWSLKKFSSVMETCPPSKLGEIFTQISIRQVTLPGRDYLTLLKSMIYEAIGQRSKAELLLPTLRDKTAATIIVRTGFNLLSTAHFVDREFLEVESQIYMALIACSKIKNIHIPEGSLFKRVLDRYRLEKSVLDEIHLWRIIGNSLVPTPEIDRLIRRTTDPYIKSIALTIKGNTFKSLESIYFYKEAIQLNARQVPAAINLFDIFSSLGEIDEIKSIFSRMDPLLAEVKEAQRQLRKEYIQSVLLPEWGYATIRNLPHRQKEAEDQMVHLGVAPGSLTNPDWACESLLYNVKGSNTGRSAWYFILVDPLEVKKFKENLKKDILYLEEHGVVLHSGYGELSDKGNQELSRRYTMPSGESCFRMGMLSEDPGAGFHASAGAGEGRAVWGILGIEEPFSRKAESRVVIERERAVSMPRDTGRHATKVGRELERVEKRGVEEDKGVSEFKEEGEETRKVERVAGYSQYTTPVMAYESDTHLKWAADISSDARKDLEWAAFYSNAADEYRAQLARCSDTETIAHLQKQIKEFDEKVHVYEDNARQTYADHLKADGHDSNEAERRKAGIKNSSCAIL